MHINAFLGLMMYPPGDNIMKVVPAYWHWHFWMPRILATGLIISLTTYTVFLFARTSVQSELFIYIIPSVVLLLFLDIALRHEKLGGALFVFGAFIFLLIYKVFIGLTVCALLLIIGILFLTDHPLIKNLKRTV